MWARSDSARSAWISSEMTSRSLRSASSPSANSSARSSIRPVGLWGFTSRRTFASRAASGGAVQVEGPIGLAGNGLHGEEAAAHLLQGSHEAGVRRCQQQHPVPRRAGELDQDTDRLDRVRQDP